MTKLLRVSENERLDKNDLDFAVRESVVDNTRAVVDAFLTNESGTRSWILDGFAISNPAASQLRVDRGRALLPLRFGTSVKYGLVASEGEASQTLDLSGYGAGTYGIYIKFQHLDGDTESRLFWSSSGGGSEYPQAVGTRYSADWALRVESVNPGSEWVKIGEVALPAMTITDQRNFYFEGPAGTYANTWGSGTDRNADRALYGIGDLQTFTDMVRTFIEEVKGGGRRWWEAGILEFYVEDYLAVGTDESVQMQSDANANRLVLEDDFADFTVDRSTHEVVWTWGSTAAAELLASGRLWLKGLGGVHIGVASFAPPSYGLGIGDGDLNLQVDSNIAYVRFDGTTDLIRQERAANKFVWRQNNVDVLEVIGGQINLLQGFLGGVRVGFVGQPGTTVLEVVDADFALGVYATKPGLLFDATDGDGLYYDRTDDRFEFVVGGAEMFELGASGNDPQMWFNSGAATADNKFLRFERSTELLKLFSSNTAEVYRFNLDEATAAEFAVAQSLSLHVSGVVDTVRFAAGGAWLRFDGTNKFHLRADGSVGGVELFTFGEDEAVRLYRDRSVGAELSALVLGGTESAIEGGLQYNPVTDVLAVLQQASVEFSFTPTAFQGPSDGGRNLGASGTRWDEVWGKQGLFNEDIQHPANQTELLARSGRNNVLALGRFFWQSTGAIDTSPGTWLHFGEGFNVTGTTGTTTDLTYVYVQLDEPVDPNSATVQITSFPDSLTSRSENYSAKLIDSGGAVFDIVLVTRNGGVRTADEPEFHLTVTGRPVTL